MRRLLCAALFFFGCILCPLLLLGADVTVTPSIGLKGEYNDNIDFTNVDAKDDWIGTIIPGLKLEYATPRFMLKTEGKVEIEQYLEETDNNTEKYNASVDMGYQYAGGSGIFGKAAFRRDTTLDQEFQETGLAGVRSHRNDYMGGLGFAHFFTQNVSAGLAYQYEKKEYSRDVYVDSETHGVAANVNYIFNDGIDTASLQPLYGIQESSEIRVYQYGLAVSLAHKIAENYEATIKAGAMYSTVSDKIGDENASGWGWIAEAGLAKRWETVSLAINLSRQDSLTSTSSFVTVNRLTASAAYKFTERLSFNLSGSLYFTKSSSVVNEETTDERSYQITPKLRYQFTEHVNLEIAYSYTNKHDFNLSSDEDYDRNQAWFLVNFEFPNKI
ncbi:MAG: hypothetical protein JW884_10135 [Deltaproteobacteria bacterium]|nr:hypothetical protein [Deltaproteobacteria bacterium]